MPAQRWQVDERTLFIKVDPTLVVPSEGIRDREAESLACDVGGALNIAVGPVHEVVVAL